MSKLTHSVYLSVIGILVAAIAGLASGDLDDSVDDPRSVAVLPFVAMGRDQSAMRLSEVVTYKLAEALVQESGIEVTPQRDTDAIARLNPNLAELGEALEVSWILEGSVQLKGNRIRITAQLVDVESHAHLWAETYVRNLDEIDAVVADVARRVADFRGSSEVKSHA